MFVRGGYVCERSNTKHGSPKDTWLVHYDGRTQSGGSVNIKLLSFPPQYVGKRIRLKVEVVYTGNPERNLEEWEEFVKSLEPYESEVVLWEDFVNSLESYELVDLPKVDSFLSKKVPDWLGSSDFEKDYASGMSFGDLGRKYGIKTATARNYMTLLSIEKSAVPESLGNVLQQMIGSEPIRTADVCRIMLEKGYVHSLSTAIRKVDFFIKKGILIKVSGEDRNFYVKISEGARE